MTRLILETSLLLLGAYFLGAWAACLVKRSFFATSKSTRDALRFEPAAATVRSGGLATQAPISPPIRRGDPRPIALETIERTSPQAAADAASRFEQVLTKVPAVNVQMQAPTPPSPQMPAPTPPAPPVNRTAPASQASVISAGVIAQAAPSTAPVATPAASTAKPATIATPIPAALPAQPLPSARPVQPVAQVLPPRPNLSSASSSSGQASAAAPIAAATIASATDDLTRIRSIDPSLGARLIKLGVGRYRDIASWLPSDVARISRALGFNGRIEQENWIEQAQILARGGETAYARKKDRGETTTSSSAVDEGMPKSNLPPTPAAVPPVAVAAGNPATVTAATMPRVSDRAAFAQSRKAPVAVQPAAQAAAPVEQKSAAPVAPQPAPKPSAATEPGLAGAAASAAAAGLGALSSTARDDLQRIGSINVEVEKLLNTQSVTRYAQIASWTAADMMRFDRLLGQEGRVKRESWIEQAQILSRGGDTAYSRQFDQRQSLGVGGAGLDVARPSRLSDAIRDTASKTGVEPASSTSRPADMSGMPSVRSEAYAGAGQGVGAKSAQVDDLKRVRGVGVLIEKKLNSMGVTSYQQIANWSAADIDRVSQVLDFRGRIERENWVEQARILSAGGQTEFSRRVDRGEVETSKIR